MHGLGAVVIKHAWFWRKLGKCVVVGRLLAFLARHGAFAVHLLRSALFGARALKLSVVVHVSRFPALARQSVGLSIRLSLCLSGLLSVSAPRQWIWHCLCQRLLFPMSPPLALC